MAEKRMFSKKITNSDMFLDMPASTQNLYFHLNLSADDDGFVDNPRMVMRMINASEDDMRLLITKEFCITWKDSALVVIKDWRIHNTIRKDRKKETIHTEVFKRLSVLENGSYGKKGPEWQPTGNQLSPVQVLEYENGEETLSHQVVQPNDNQPATNCQHRLDKISIDKISIDKTSTGENSTGENSEQSLSFEEFNIFNFIQANFNRVLSPIEMETLNFWLKEFDKELIQEATRMAVMNNKYNLKYIEAILKNWERNNITTVAMAREEDEKWRSRQNKTSKSFSSNRKETLPDWAGKEMTETPLNHEEEMQLKKQLEELRAK